MEDTGSIVAAAWRDVDADGFPDAYVARYDTPNQLYRNNGDGTFGRIPFETAVAPGGWVVSASWAEADNDDDLDLAAGGPDFFLNDGPGNLTLSEGMVSDALRVSGSTNEAGVSWADYDNDGLLDLVIGGWFYPSPAPPNSWFHDEGQGAFSAASAGPVTTDLSPSLGMSWADFDMDGDLDLFVSNGLYTGAAPNFLFQNNADGSFTRITDAAPVSEEQLTASPAWIDYDDDGFLDLFGNDGPLMYGWSERIANLYHNEGNANHWLKVKCVGAAGPSHTPSSAARVSNRDGVGAKVWLTATIRGQELRQLREITAGSGRGGSTPLEAHFGLGDAIMATTLRVEWPSGQVTELQDVAADQRRIVPEPRPGPRLLNPSFADGTFQFSLSGEPGASVRLQRSANLQDWTDWQTVTLGAEPVELTDPEAATSGARFYRAIMP